MLRFQPVNGDLVISIRQESVALLPERAMLLPDRGVLLVADLHLGKAETYRSLGVPMPEGIAEESLERLERAIVRTRPERVVVLGDLVHCEEGMEDPIIEVMDRWRHRVTLPISLIGGNHDANVAIPRSWRIDDDGDARRLGPFILRHEPRSRTEAGNPEEPFLIAGHLHPVLSMGTGARRVLAHAFVVDVHQAILPAFTPFARGARVTPDEHRTVHAVADGTVVTV